MINEESFKAEDGEEEYSLERVAVLLMYIDHHDFVGYANMNAKYIESLEPGKNNHPDGKAWVAPNHKTVGTEHAHAERLTPAKDQPPDGKVLAASENETYIVTREQGWEAFKRAGRKINAALVELFPNKQVVWSRAPVGLR